MHEVALARDLLKHVESRLDSDRIRVLRIDIAVGAAAGVIADSLRLAFDLLAVGTRAEGAEIFINSLPARSRCTECGTIFEFESLIGNCTECGRLGGELLSGSEITLRSIEVADV